jgi:DNA repair protein RadC
MKTIQRIELRVSRVKISEDGAEYGGRRVSHAADVATIARALIGQAPQELFLCFHLDVKNRVLGYVEVARGSVSSCTVAPREVYRAAVLAGATAVIFAHNHPSGDTTPSSEDVYITKRLSDCGKLLGIQVLDHVIVTEDQHFSFLDGGLLNYTGGTP